MRVCRFRFEDLELLGFYSDDRIVPIDQAAEAFGQEEDDDLGLRATTDLLDLLPPDGPSFWAASRLAAWIDRLDPERFEALAIPLDEVDLLVPIPQPPKLLLLAGNYAKHVEERGYAAAERAETFPYVFMKPPSTTLRDPDAPVLIPSSSPDQIDWECELGVVIGRRGRNIPEAEALDFVAGYTVVNDISDRGYRPNPGRKPRERDKHFDWLHGKWHDTFCPMGPCILSADAVDDPQTLRLQLTVNGAVKQDASTAQMVFPVAAIIEFLSRSITLEPGDVISTGTPSGVGSSSGTYLRPGDLVVATIDRIGSLRSPIEAESAES